MGAHMRIGFSRESTYVPEWNDNRKLPEPEQIKARIKPMKVSDLLLVMEAMGRRPGEPEPGVRLDDPNRPSAPPEAELQRIDVNALLREAGHILPKYVTIENLNDETGPVTVQDLLEYGAFLTLAAELIMECARRSMPSEAAEKNLSQPSA